jgi:hypothetical protein
MVLFGGEKRSLVTVDEYGNIVQTSRWLQTSAARSYICAE